MGAAELLAALALLAAWPQETAAEPPAGQPAAKVDPASDEILRLGRLGAWDAALQAARTAAAKNPAGTPARLLVARAAAALGQAQVVRGQLEAGAVEHAGHPEIHMALGDFAVNEGRWADGDLHYLHADRLAAEGKFPAAAVAEWRAALLSGRAGIAEFRGQWNDAAKWLGEFVVAKPDNAPARRRLAQALAVLQRPDEALKNLEQAVALEKSADAPATLLARMFANRGDTARAKEWFEKAAAGDVAQPGARVAYGIWLLDQDDPKSAAAQAEAVLAKDARHADARKLRAVCWRRQGDFAKAKQSLEEIAADSPGDTFAANLLALVLCDVGDAASLKQAQTLMEAGLRRSGRQGETAAVLAWAQYRQGALEPAEKAMQIALASGPVTAELAFCLAHIAAARGRLDDTRRLLEGAAGPRHQYTQEARDWLGKLQFRPRSAGPSAAPPSGEKPATGGD